MTPNSPVDAKGRNTRLDVYRAVAMLAVVCIHTMPFRELSTTSVGFNYLYVLINQFSRFAVPFFLIVSGYLFGRKVTASANATDVARDYYDRLKRPIVFFNLLYLLALSQTANAKEYGLLTVVFWAGPVNLLFEGVREHLWFLVSLVLTLWTLALLLWRKFSPGAIFTLAAGLYATGLVCGSYSSVFSIDIGFNTRDFIFLSTLCVVLGFRLSRRKSSLTDSQAFAVAASGFALHMTEVILLWKFWNVSPTSHDYLLGTIFFAYGFSVLAIRGYAAPKRGLAVRILGTLGRYTLGVYCGHILILEMLARYSKFFPATAWELLFPFAVYAVTFCPVYLLAKTRAKAFVT